MLSISSAPDCREKPKEMNKPNTRFQKRKQMKILKRYCINVMSDYTKGYFKIY